MWRCCPPPPFGRLLRLRKCQAETTQSGWMTCERRRRMEPVKGGQRRVERCQSGHTPTPPPILEQIKARPAHILSVNSDPSGVQAFALLYSESFHSGGTKKKIIYLDGNDHPPLRTTYSRTFSSNLRHFRCDSLRIFCLHENLFPRNMNLSFLFFFLRWKT